MSEQRLPPMDVEAEMSVLGALILGDKTAIDKVSSQLARDDFYRDAHGRIFEAMLALHERDEPVDIVTLKGELEQRKILDSVGGIGYLIQLGEFVPTTANISFYAKTVVEKAALRRLIETAGEVAGMAYSQSDEPETILGLAEAKILEIRGRGVSTGRFKRLKQSLDDEWNELDARALDGNALTGVPSGFTVLDDMTGGYQDGDFIIIAARPSMGKTSLALQMAEAAAMRSGPTAFFSIEMSEETLRQRLLCMEASVDSLSLRRGFLREIEWTRLSEATDRLWNAPLFIDDSTDLSAMDMRTRCRELRAREGDLRMVVVDYIQLLRPIRQGSNTNTNTELTETAKALKSLAREMDCPVIALSQLSRAVERREDKRPMLSDLRDSGGLEAEADVIKFVYRPQYYAKKEMRESAPPEDPNALPPAPNSPYDAVGVDADQEEAEIIVGKQRNGPTGRVKLGFVSRFARFENLKGATDGTPDF